MPSRILREGILTSRAVNALSEEAELFYWRLLLVVDDYGRYEADPVLLRAACYPRKIDVITNKQVDSFLVECSTPPKPLLILYEINQKKYLEIANFGQRTRSPSKFPAPPGVQDVHGKSGKIYFIQAEGSKRIKIGYTEWKPESRLLALQPGCPERLQLLGYMAGSVKIERDLQQRFSVDSVGGEWFNNSPELVNFITESCSRPPATENIEHQMPANVRQCPPLRARARSESESYSESEANVVVGEGDDVSGMQKALEDFMDGKWGKPDRDIAEKALAACNGAALIDISTELLRLHRSGARPVKSWGWFVTMLSRRFR